MTQTHVRTKEIRPEKIEAVAEIKVKFQKAKIAIFTDYQGKQGLPVTEMQKLRRKLREGKGEFKIVKNTLTEKALEELKIENLAPHLKRATGIAFGYEDPAVIAKTLFEFAAEHKTEAKGDPGLPTIRAGFFEQRVIDANQIRYLATLPPMPVLMSKLLGTMNAPVTGLVTVLSGTIRSVVTVLDAIRKQKEA